MVHFDEGYPEPDNPPEELPSNDIIVAFDLDTDEEDNNPYNEYEPLPVNDWEGSDEERGRERGRNSGFDPARDRPFEVLPIEILPTNELAAEHDSQVDPSPSTIEMDNDKVEAVKQAMENFTLPESSIPQWAHDIPEEQWKERLINMLREKDT